MSTKTGHIFHTVTTDAMSVAVGLESLTPTVWPSAGAKLMGRLGVAHDRTGLVVRTHVGMVVMALPVAHVSAAILAEMFDSTDAAAILARIAE